MRNWKDLQDDEIFAIWSAYKRTDYNYDILHLRSESEKPMRLTPMEIHSLVDELLDRLEIKKDKK